MFLIGKVQNDHEQLADVGTVERWQRGAGDILHSGALKMIEIAGNRRLKKGGGGGGKLGDRRLGDCRSGGTPLNHGLSLPEGLRKAREHFLSN